MVVLLLSLVVVFAFFYFFYCFFVLFVAVVGGGGGGLFCFQFINVQGIEAATWRQLYQHKFKLQPTIYYIISTLCCLPLSSLYSFGKLDLHFPIMFLHHSNKTTARVLMQACNTQVNIAIMYRGDTCTEQQYVNTQSLCRPSRQRVEGILHNDQSK